MALPQSIDVSTPPDSQAPSLGDDRIREFKQAFVDIFGVYTSGPVTVAYLVGGADGVTQINFRNPSAPAGGGVEGRLFKYLSAVRYDDGTHVQVLNGTLSWNMTTVGNTGGGEDDLMSYTIPAGFLASGNGSPILEIIAGGTFADTAGNKTLKLKIGSGSSTTLNGVTAGPQNKMWWAHFMLYSTVANSEFAIGQFVIDPGSTEGPINVGAAEATASAITIKFTGESAGSTTNDVTQKFMLVRQVAGTGITA